MAKAIRTTEEYIVLALSGGSFLGVLPFVFMRFANQDWLIGGLDLLAIMVAGGLFVYVWRTHKAKYAGRLLACFCITMVFLTVWVKGAAQTVWIYPALSAIFFLLNTYIAALLCAVLLIAMGVIIWPQLDTFTALQVYVSVLATLAFSYAFADRMRYQQKQLEHLATKDPLTEAGNRRSMEQKLLEIGAHQRRDQDSQSSLILMDIDNFKKLNDNHGHNLGDEMLVELVRTVHKRIRNSDTLFRFGGEEFVVIAENTELQAASALAEHLREAIEQAPALKKYDVTVSVGTAQFQLNETPFEWLGRADRAMYKAKNAGRNTCVVAA